MNNEDPRRGWAEAFAQMAASGEDILIETEALDHEWDLEDWESTPLA
ncbi:MAG: hypothetical protein HYZ26_01670 [Chloroflexi bacterium]|nr:hypothetical protein [Chloroflexota bacterium]